MPRPDPLIHPTAIVSPKAHIALDVEIGPYAVVEDGVEVGPGTKIWSHVYLTGNTRIGQNCQIHTGSIIGHHPQILGHKPKDGKLLIGNNNIFREYVTIHCGQAELPTVIGNNNYFMGFSHVAHDCVIGNDVIVCNGALVAGTVTIEDKVFISANVGIHQYCTIGSLAMISGLTRVSKDVPPYMIIIGNSQVWGINTIGLKRAGFNSQMINDIKRAYKLLYRSGLNVAQALEAISKGTVSGEVKHLIEFIKVSKRGICGPRRFGLLSRLFLEVPLLVRSWIPRYRLFERSYWREEGPSSWKEATS